MTESINRPEHPEHSNAARIIALSETRHFDGEGLSGDVYVSREDAKGYRVRHVEVDGERPLIEILRVPHGCIT